MEPAICRGWTAGAGCTHRGIRRGTSRFIIAKDRILLAGDAVATVNMDSYVALATQRQDIATGGAPFICDWTQYGRSLWRLADLEPVVLACGHGVPMKGGKVAGDFGDFCAALLAAETWTVRARTRANG